MKNKKILAIFMVIAMIAVALTGCGGGENKEPASTNEENQEEANESEEKTEDSEAIDEDQSITIVNHEPQPLDPSTSSDVYSAIPLNEITEGLARVEVDENGLDVIAPAGAEKWEQSEDGLVWTFHLRDYNWEDGEPVTAQNFEYGIKRTISPDAASPYAFLLFPIKNATACNEGKKELDELGVKAVDDKTLEITLERPCPYFEKLIAFKTFYPQREDKVKEWGDKNGTEPEYTISCGPFKLTDWVHKSEMVLEKNENYYDKDKVKLDKITYCLVENKTTRYNMFANGELDTCGVNKPEWLEKFKKRDEMKYTLGPDPSTSYQFYNQDIKLFSNTKVRQAFNLALDREDICEVLYYGLAEPAYGWIPPTLMLGDKEYRDLAEEPLKKLKEENPDPKQLLIEGLKELGMDPDPSKLTVTLLESGTDAENKRFAEYFQQAYEKNLGINVKVEYMDWAVFSDKTQNGEYEIAGMGWIGDYNDPMTFLDLFITGSSMSKTGWSNKKYDELVDEGGTSFDSKERLKAYQEAEKILVTNDANIAPTVYRKKSRFEYNHVKGVMYPMFGSGAELKYAYIQGRDK